MFCEICERRISSTKIEEPSIKSGNKQTNVQNTTTVAASGILGSDLPLSQKLFIIEERHQQYQHISLQNEKYRQLIEKYLLPSSQNSELNELQTRHSELTAQLEIFRQKKAKLLQTSKLFEKQKDFLTKEKDHLLQQIKTLKADQHRLELITQLKSDLQDVLIKKTDMLLMHRIRMAVQLFEMMKVESPDLLHQQKKRERQKRKSSIEDTEAIKITGYSSILSIPIPNYGIFDGMAVDIALMGMLHLTNLIDRLAMIFNLPLPNPMQVEDTLNQPTISLQSDLSVEYSLLPVHVLKKARSQYRGFDWTPLNGLFQEHRQAVNKRREALTSDNRNKKEGIEVEEDSEAEYLPNPDFSTKAFPALAENVVYLCEYFGLDTETTLWPAGAIVWNLQILALRLRTLLQEAEKCLLGPLLSSQLEEGNEVKFEEHVWTHYSNMIHSLSTSNLLRSSGNSRNSLSPVPEEVVEEAKEEEGEREDEFPFLADLLQSRAAREYAEELRLRYLHRFSLRKRQEYQDFFQHYRDMKSQLLSDNTAHDNRRDTAQQNEEEFETSQAGEYTFIEAKLPISTIPTSNSNNTSITANAKIEKGEEWDLI